MSEPNLNKLERDVEVARAKLADNLSTLSRPEAYAEFSDELKREARQVTNAAVRRAKFEVQDRAESYLENLKARAAANPAAVLAIAAGVAWRLFRKPPIATTLVGAGLISLLRTSPSIKGPREASDYLSEAKLRLKEQASDLAHNVKDEAVKAGRTVADKTTELASAGTEQLMEWGEQARSSIQQVTGGVQEQEALNISYSQANNGGREWENSGGERRRSSRGSVIDEETQDTLLLGAAGVAVAAALAIAVERRLADENERREGGPVGP